MDGLECKPWILLSREELLAKNKQEIRAVYLFPEGMVSGVICSQGELLKLALSSFLLILYRHLNKTRYFLEKTTDA